MSRREAQIVLICEDSQHESFARRFLERAGWDRRKIRVVKAPGGRGSAEQFVRRTFPAELAALRRRQVDRSIAVLIDGDRLGPRERLAQLDEACVAADVPPRTKDDRAAVFVPKRQIETWLAYLGGETVDESRDDYPRLQRPRDCKSHVAVLATMCERSELRLPAPPSLEAACVEFQLRLVRESR